MARLGMRHEKGSQPSAQARGSANDEQQDGSDSTDQTASRGESGMCRICFRGFRAGSLLSPCNCRGTIGLVHRDCLEEWLSRENTDQCSICSYQFEVERPPESVLDWIREPRRQRHVWYILAEMLLSVFCAVMLLVSACLFAVEIIRGMPPVLGSVLGGIIMVLAGLLCTAHIYLMVSRHDRALMHWRQNWGVRLVLPNVPGGAAAMDASDLPMFPAPLPRSEFPFRSYQLATALPASTETPRRRLR